MAAEGVDGPEGGADGSPGKGKGLRPPNDPIGRVDSGVARCTGKNAWIVFAYPVESTSIRVRSYRVKPGVLIMVCRWAVG